MRWTFYSETEGQENILKLTNPAAMLDQYEVTNGSMEVLGEPMNFV